MAAGYRLGDWTVRPHQNRIERGGRVVHLAPKAMAVLDRLARASNAVVTRREIFDSVWPGATISDEALTQRIAEIRKAFGDSAQDPQIVETIPKVGFRLIPDVVPLHEEAPLQRPELQPAQGAKRRPGWLLAAMAGVLLLALSLGLLLPLDPGTVESPADAGIPVIAVLPFVNMSSDPQDEYLSDGISEELINLLVRVPGLHVVSRTSSFAFKDESPKMADLARELNASLIVEGTVRKVGSKVRITAQLIEPATDRHLWSESYDRELSDIFALQEEIAQSIVTALQGEIGVQTVVASRPTENIEAYELFLSGRHEFYQRGAALDSAIMLLRMAVEKDPGFAEAWTYLAAAATVAGFYRTSIGNEEAWRISEDASARALALDPGLALAQAAQAMAAYGSGGDVKRCFELIDRAVELDPHDATIRLWAGLVYWFWGYIDQAHDHFLAAHAQDPRMGVTIGFLGQVYLAMGRDELAAPFLARATELGYPNHRYVEASLLMKRGDIDAAFAKLKITFADPGADPDLIGWVRELEAAGRAYIDSPATADALVAVIERAPRPEIAEKARLALLFDLEDRFFEYFKPSVEEGNLWLAYVVPTLWLPEYRDYIEDPRYLEIMREDGAVDLWEQRGYLDGCVRVNDPLGEHLDCSKRYP